jgi:hypothetical protein
VKLVDVVGPEGDDVIVEPFADPTVVLDELPAPLFDEEPHAAAAIVRSASISTDVRARIVCPSRNMSITSRSPETRDELWLEPRMVTLRIAWMCSAPRTAETAFAELLDDLDDDD